MSKPKSQKPERPLFIGAHYPPAALLEEARELKRERGFRIKDSLHRAVSIGLDILARHPEYMFKDVPVEKLSPE